MVTTNTIKSIQDIMRKDTGVDGDAQRISQQVWMLFLKIFDDKEKEYELLDLTYKSPIPQELRWRNWAANDEGITGEVLLNFINNELFPKLKNISFKDGDDPRGFVVKSVFEDAYNYMKSGTLMRQVINRINHDFDFNSSDDRHVFNDIYEKILNDLQSAGNAGEFYTPRAITEFIVEMVKPKLGDKIIDPACGTGGFLTCAIEHIRRNYVKTAEQEKLLQESIYGFDKKPLPHLLCVTNMILHSIEIPINIRHDNALTRPLRDYTPADKVDIVLMNPPFGGIEEDGIENNFPADLRTKETAELFLILVINLLKSGGKAGIILPEGDPLSGEGVNQRIREKLLSECNLHTIVKLPRNVFAPYASIRTNLLFFEKGGPTKEIWFFEHPYPEGIKCYSKTKPIKLEEFNLEKGWWKDRKESEYSWKVTMEEIASKNYDLDIENPNRKQKEYISSDEVASTYFHIKDEIQDIVERIHSEVDGVSKDIDIVFKNFEILSRSVTNIENLKKILLKSAIRGNITHNNNLDSNNQWQEKTLEEVIELKYGKGLPSGEIGNIPVYGANGVKKYYKKPLVEKSCIIVGRKGSVGALNISYDPCWPTDVTYFVEETNSVIFKFVYYLLQSLDLPALAKGIKPGLRRKDVYKIKVKIPPYSEQAEIVKKIDRLMQLCSELENKIKNSQMSTDLFMKSVLYETSN